MRRAINSISTMEGRAIALGICASLRDIEHAFQRIYFPPSGQYKSFAADLSSKIEVMKASVEKVEWACYNVHVRGTERPEGWSDDLSEERGKRPFQVDEDVGGSKRRRER
jgi:Translin family